MAYADLRKGRVSQGFREYLITTVTHGRVPVFTDFHAARRLIREMRRLEADGHCVWLAWVVMPDHLHGLLALGEAGELERAINLLKGRSARAINLGRRRDGRLWQASYHDHALRAEEDRRAIARYVVANPVRAGLVARLGEYPHWDSIWL